VGDERPLSADRVPTLTEVVEIAPPATDTRDVVDATPPAVDLLEDGPVSLAEVLPPAPVPVLPDTQMLVTQVLAELAPRIDMLFESRLREALAPALARAADGLIRDTRGDLSATLRELVDEAVVRALQRRTGR
jgi:hypothetical protein